MDRFTATQLKNRTGDVLAAAAQVPVAIERHGTPRFVILSIEEFDKMITQSNPQRAGYTADMPDDEAARLIAALEEDED